MKSLTKSFFTLAIFTLFLNCSNSFAQLEPQPLEGSTIQVYILNTVFVSKIIATDNMQGSQIINMEVLKNSIGSPKDEKLVNKNSAIIASFFDVYFKKGYEIVSTSGQFDATTYILRKR